MKKSITRRSFIKTGTVVGATTLVSASALGRFAEADSSADSKSGDKPTDLIALTGPTYFEHTLRAIETLGGIGEYRCGVRRAASKHCKEAG